MDNSAAIRLHEAIQKAQERFSRTYDVFGPGDPMVRDAASRLQGMEDAFELVFEQRYIDWWLAYEEQSA